MKNKETIKKVCLWLRDNGYRNQKIVFSKLKLEGTVYEVGFKLLNPETGKPGNLNYSHFIYSLSLKIYE
jgi:hypothetical protein